MTAKVKTNHDESERKRDLKLNEVYVISALLINTPDGNEVLHHKRNTMLCGM